MVMKYVLPILLACLVGTCLAIQPIFNTAVAKTAGSIWYGALCSMTISMTIILSICFINDRFAVIREGGISQLPKMYILVAGTCGVLILGFTIFCITKIGPVMTASITVSMQMLVATVTAHFGMFGLEQEPINWVKIVGIVFLVVGVILVKMSFTK